MGSFRACQHITCKERKAMRKVVSLLLTALIVLSVSAAWAESAPVEGKVVSTQSYAIVSQVKGVIEQIRFSVGDHVNANDCLATVATTKVYAPVTGTVYMWGKEGQNTQSVADQYGAVAYIEPSSPYTITTNPVDANGMPVSVHPGQMVYLICVNDGKKTGEGVIVSVSNNEYTVRVEKSNFQPSDKISIYTTPDHQKNNRIGRGFLKKTETVSSTGTGYIVKTHVSTGDKVNYGDLLFETIEGSFMPGAVSLNQVFFPENGVIESISVSRGQEISENQTIAVFYPDSTMRIRALVPERSLYEYQIGETVYITYQNGNVSQRPFIGKIEKISQIPEQTEYTYDTYYTVYIIITENNHSLFYGMNVLVYLQNPYQDIP